ncbi:tRNA N(3)-methylcytidine methyltransferase METTL6 isoform X2 [Varanus komodoensis]|uniref:tRNA N(3)-methylcytidine methyltransferase METTL6 isoform X2 n=1 Tax=Varanus komodoensis TaxID=61221 RepID=UPI001CF77E4C|nr:tRNA N(3)-methylcytidine methyltransferase METTL6 isoform X2 [Varanus komodoensis]
MNESRPLQGESSVAQHDVIISTCEDAPFQNIGHKARILSPQEAKKLAEDQISVSDFKQAKLEKEAQKNWDLFYKRNSINFFKDRHWTTREFEELKTCREFEDQKLTILEAGCGVGNCLFPLLEEDLNIFAYACDFSPRAVEYVKVLKPGKCVLFRDYGLYDHAMLRFKSASKLGENFYVRQDGTRSYFFAAAGIQPWQEMSLEMTDHSRAGCWMSPS